MERPQISVVIPLFNEEENVQPLLDELFAELARLGRTHEVICVDDGSRDGTFAALARLAAQRPELRVIRFRLNFGQTAAMSADRKSTRLNSSHSSISYAVFCLKKKKTADEELGTADGPTPGSNAA